MSELFNTSSSSLFFAFLAVIDLKAFYKGTVSAIIPLEEQTPGLEVTYWNSHSLQKSQDFQKTDDCNY